MCCAMRQGPSPSCGAGALRAQLGVKNGTTLDRPGHMYARDGRLAPGGDCRAGVFNLHGPVGWPRREVGYGPVADQRPSVYPTGPCGGPATMPSPGIRCRVAHKLLHAVLSAFDTSGPAGRLFCSKHAYEKLLGHIWCDRDVAASGSRVRHRLHKTHARQGQEPCQRVLPRRVKRARSAPHRLDVRLPQGGGGQQAESRSALPPCADAQDTQQPVRVRDRAGDDTGQLDWCVRLASATVTGRIRPCGNLQTGDRQQLLTRRLAGTGPTRANPFGQRRRIAAGCPAITSPLLPILAGRPPPAARSARAADPCQIRPPASPYSISSALPAGSTGRRVAGQRPATWGIDLP